MWKIWRVIEAEWLGGAIERGANFAWKNIVETLKAEAFLKTKKLEINIMEDKFKNQSKSFSDWKGARSLELWEIKDNLASKWIDISQLMANHSEYNKTTMTWENLFDVFLIEKKDQIASCSDLTEVEKLFQVWNDERLDYLKILIDDESNLKAIAANEKLRNIMKADISEDEKADQIVDVLWKLDRNQEVGIAWLGKFASYSYRDILGWILQNYNFSGKRNDWFRKLQVFAKFNTAEDKEVSHDWWWWRQTSTFLKNILNTSSFNALPDADTYRDIINNILNTHDWFDEVDWLFKNIDDVNTELQKYLENPVAYWRNQVDAPRVDRWGKHFYSSLESSTEQERSFVDSHRNSKLDWDIRSKIDLRDKEKWSEDYKDVFERVRKLLPQDKMNEIIQWFLSDDDIIFGDGWFNQLFWKEFPGQTMNMVFEKVKDSIINFEHPADEYSVVRDWFYWKLVSKFDGNLIWFTWELAWFIRWQAWISALWLRKQYLERAFWFSIKEVEVKNWDPEIFYFSDAEYPDTIYEYNPLTWRIDAVLWISMKWEVINFWMSDWKEKKFICEIPKFDDLLGRVDVWDLLDFSWERKDNISDLKEDIWTRIEKYMQFSEWSVVETRNKENNEIERMRNGIVIWVKDLLWIDKDSLSERDTQDRPYYQIMSAVFRTVEQENDKTRLEALNQFIWKFRQLQEQWYLSVDLNSVQDPLLKFVVEKNKGLTSSSWESFIKDLETWWYMKRKSLAFWSIMRLLISVIDWEEKLDVNKILELNQSSLDSEKYLSFEREVWSEYSKVLENSNILWDYASQLWDYQDEVKFMSEISLKA